MHKKLNILRFLNIGLSLVVLYLLAETIFTVTTPEALLKTIKGPTIEEKKIITYEIKSEYQGSSTHIRVLLPDNFDKCKQYKVLYILPTVPHKFDFWWNSGILEAVKYNIQNKYDVICIYPTFERMPWYGDNPDDPNTRQESHFMKFVVPWVDEHFPTIKKAEGRYLLGISKSGCGAFTLLLRYPDIFGKAVAWDAPLFYDDVTKVKEAETEEVFGSNENFKDYYLPNLLKDKAEQFREGPIRFILMGYGFCKTDMEKSHLLMQSLGIPHIYDNIRGRKHQWQSGWFPEAAKYLFEKTKLTLYKS